MRSNHERCRKQSLKESEKVINLPMKITCYSEEGLLTLGTGNKTLEILGDLINKTKYWVVPKIQRNALFLMLE